MCLLGRTYYRVCLIYLFLGDFFKLVGWQNRQVTKTQNPKKIKIEKTYVFIAADPVFAGE